MHLELDNLKLLGVGGRLLKEIDAMVEFTGRAPAHVALTPAQWDQIMAAVRGWHRRHAEERSADTTRDELVWTKPETVSYRGIVLYVPQRKRERRASDG